MVWKRLPIALLLWALVTVPFILALTGCRITVNLNNDKNNSSGGQEEYEPTPDLVYTLKEDGTYSVSVDGEFYSETLYVPSVRNGRAVTEIAADGFVASQYLTTAVIPEGVVSIGSHAFDNCPVLSSITLPSTLKTVGSYAFSGCVSITELVIPDGVESIGFGALMGCKSLESLTLPFVGGGVKGSNYLGYLFEAESYEFQAKSVSKSLKKITVTRATDIYSYAFYNCKHITDVTLSNATERISWGAFYNCISLETVILPEGVNSIGIRAFASCTALKMINLPVSLTAIENGAFVGCNALTDIYYGGTFDEWLKISKTVGWNGDDLEFVIHCTDQDVQISMGDY